MYRHILFNNLQDKKRVFNTVPLYIFERHNLHIKVSSYNINQIFNIFNIIQINLKIFCVLKIINIIL